MLLLGLLSVLLFFFKVLEYGVKCGCHITTVTLIQRMCICKHFCDVYRSQSLAMAPPHTPTVQAPRTNPRNANLHAPHILSKPAERRGSKCRACSQPDPAVWCALGASHRQKGIVSALYYERACFVPGNVIQCWIIVGIKVLCGRFWQTVCSFYKWRRSLQIADFFCFIALGNVFGISRVLFVCCLLHSTTSQVLCHGHSLHAC